MAKTIMYVNSKNYVSEHLITTANEHIAVYGKDHYVCELEELCQRTPHYNCQRTYSRIWQRPLCM